MRVVQHFALSTVWPPAAAIRDLLVFGDLGDLKKIRGHKGPETRQQRQKSGFPRSWGPFWAKRLPTEFDRSFKKCGFIENGGFYSSFSALRAPYTGRAH